MSHILLVEDEPDTREVIVEALCNAGFDVTATCTGDEAAILMADQDRFDLLLTDINMPGDIDGIGLAEHAREVHPGLPVVFVSGRPETERQADHVGPPMRFVSKPCDEHTLVGVVRSLV